MVANPSLIAKNHKDHYVSQTCLKQFALPGTETLITFDFQNMSTERVNIGSLCWEKGFDDPNLETLNKHHHGKTLSKYWTEINPNQKRWKSENRWYWNIKEIEQDLQKRGSFTKKTQIFYGALNRHHFNAQSIYHQGSTSTPSRHRTKMEC